MCNKKKCVNCKKVIDRKKLSHPITNNQWKNKKFCEYKCYWYWMKGKLIEEIFGIESAKRIIKLKSGENNFWWNGGTGYIPYDSKFTSSLKRKISIRDNFTCKLCDEKALIGECHHIHYNKQDSRPETLVWSHKICNMIANNNRDFWFSYCCFVTGRTPEEVLI